MKRKNATRHALFTSIISLLLCVSMLVGTTFAWFTDSVESGYNTIAAGNLDVELNHADKGTSGTLQPVSSSTVLFDDVTLWEPGAALYETLQVMNAGTLALKYNLNLNVLKESVVDGYKLSDFGVARMLRETSEATVIGSRSFMAPEILTGLMANKGRKAYSNTVDIYSLGMTMYILLNDGREPFLPPEPHPVTEGDRACAEHRLLSGETLPLPAHCGRELGRIIIRACAADPARRFRTADDMREALLNYLES